VFRKKRGVCVPRVTRKSHIFKQQRVRLLDADGDLIGIMHPSKALSMANESGFDLIEVAPDTDPPVCRMIDYDKYKRKQRIQAKSRRQNQKSKAKQIKLQLTTAEHDYQLKKQNAKEFLLSGAKVILTVMFRGRQRSHPKLGVNMLKRMADELTNVGEVLSQPRLNGCDMSIVMVPRIGKTIAGRIGNIIKRR
jgi:translation initiation factor IF-3